MISWPYTQPTEREAYLRGCNDESIQWFSFSNNGCSTETRHLLGTYILSQLINIPMSYHQITREKSKPKLQLQPSQDNEKVDMSYGDSQPGHWYSELRVQSTSRILICSSWPSSIISCTVSDVENCESLSTSRSLICHHEHHQQSHILYPGNFPHPVAYYETTRRQSYRLFNLARSTCRDMCSIPSDDRYSVRWPDAGIDASWRGATLSFVVSVCRAR